MPSTKPEVHNVSHRRQRKTEPRPQATFTEDLFKFALVVVTLLRHEHTHVFPPLMSRGLTPLLTPTLRK